MLYQKRLPTVAIRSTMHHLFHVSNAAIAARDVEVLIVPAIYNPLCWNVDRVPVNDAPESSCKQSTPFNRRPACYFGAMWPDQDETRELLNGAQQGNREAVERLMDRHRDSLNRMVRCRLNRGLAGRVDASDIVQDALLTASRRLTEYLENPRLPFHAWLRQLARDRLADAYRRQLADKRNVDREQPVVAFGERSSLIPIAQLRDLELTPAATLLRKEFAARFHQAVDQLAEDSRDIILMRHAEQLTNSQSAEALGLSEPAAAMRYLRALRQLKSILGETPSMLLE